MQRKQKFTKKQIAFIKEHRLKMTASDIALKLRVSDCRLFRFMRENKLSVPKRVWMKLRAAKQRQKTSSNPATDSLLKEFHLFTPVKTMADLIGRSHTFIVTRMRQLNLIQSRELKEEFIQEARIKKGKRL